MPESSQTARTSARSVNAAVIGAAVIATLYFGRELLIPIALSVLLTFILIPLVAWLRRRGIPRIPAVIVAVLLAFTVVGATKLKRKYRGQVELARNNYAIGKRTSAGPMLDEKAIDTQSTRCTRFVSLAAMPPDLRPNFASARS